ncbi:MAG: ATP-dependent helicase [Bradymonadaceae bacterium]
MLEALNPEQRRAVEHREGPLLILAGAGSGKTRVVTRRIAHLIVEGEAEPEQILAVTFTNKAADEMAARVDHLIDEYADRSLVGEPTISTFHALGARILRRYGGPIGLDWNYTILDQDDQLDLVEEIGQRQGTTRDHGERKRLRRFIERMKNRGLTPTEARETTADRDEEEAAEFYERYQREMRAANCADFGELLLGCLELFRDRAELAARLSDRWRYIMVDEFQDTNPAQYELLEHLTAEHDNLAVVGDDDQAIYRWRDATVENILGFDDDFEQTEVVKLEQNYRSTEEILGVANDVVRKIPGRREKRLWTDRGSGSAPTVFTARDADEEAEFVAEEIQRLGREGESYSDIAVFYRTNAQSRHFEETFGAKGIPYLVVGGTKFFERREIRDVLAYMRLVLNPEDDVAFLRVIGTPTRGVGDVTVEKLRAATGIPGIESLFDAARLAAGMEERPGVGLERLEVRATAPEHGEALDELKGLGGRPRSGIEDFCELVVDLREALAGGRDVAEVADTLLERTSYLSYIADRSDERGRDRVENVRELLRAMGEYELDGVDGGEPEGTVDDLLAASEGGRVLRGFLEQSTLTREDAEETATGAVQLMTVHAAKGLEFDTVFVVGMEDRLFPNRSRDERLEPEERHEERRLAYVAFTRARDRLYVTNARSRHIYGETRKTSPSRFLADIEEDRLSIDPRSRADEVQYRPRRRSGPGGGYGTSSGGWQYDQTTGGEDPYAESVAHTVDREPDYHSQVPSDEGGPGGENDAGELVGRTVTHPSFGVGEIVEVAGRAGERRLTIRFPEAGEKTVYESYVDVLD